MTVYDDDEGPLNFNVGALRASIIVPGRIVVYGFTVYNILPPILRCRSSRGRSLRITG